MLPRAVFIDKDGIIIENVPYNVDIEQIRLLAGALDGLKLLHAAGFKIIIISNQSGVAHGKFKEEDIKPVEAHLRQLLEGAGVPLTGFYYCPHHPDGKTPGYAIHCFCRKPSPGLLFQAGRDHDLNLARSWMIGDILNDVEAGRRADCRTILVNNGNETDWKLSVLRQPHYSVPNLLGATEAILNEERGVAPAPAARTFKMKVPNLSSYTPAG